MTRMAAEAPPDRQDPLAAAWPGALPLLLERVATLEDAVAALLSNALTEATRDGARREAHRLAGALGSVGVGSGSVVARDLPPGTVANGNPARVRGRVADLTDIGERVDADDASAARFRLADPSGRPAG
jgi:hypothetical protein